MEVLQHLIYLKENSNNVNTSILVSAGNHLECIHHFMLLMFEMFRILNCERASSIRKTFQSHDISTEWTDAMCNAVGRMLAIVKNYLKVYGAWI